MRQNEALEKKTLGQKTEDRLMKYILDRPIQIGEKIPNEYALTELFDVGRSTIREAVKGLVSRGVLEVRRGDGTYVISTSIWKMMCWDLEESEINISLLWICLRFA